MKKAPSYQLRITSFLKKMGRIGVLLAIKESYLLSKNILGLTVHPFKTLRAISREKDRSQQLLLLGLPLYGLAGGLLVIIGGRRLIGAPEQWGVLARLATLAIAMVTVTVAGYLGFWLVKIWRAGRNYG